MNPSSFKLIMFDLGGVIIDLAVDRTIRAFAELTGRTQDEILSAYLSRTEFFEFETGKISTGEFRDRLRAGFNFQASDAAIDSAWNAMLVSLPHQKLELLHSLRKKLTVVALSNTNAEHLRCINEEMMPRIITNHILEDFFDESYFSHDLKLRKPDPAIYQYVLNDQGILPEHALFLDDNKDNLEAASKQGIQTILISRPDEVIKIFKPYV